MKALLALVVLQLLCHGAQAVTCNQLCTCTVSYTCDACVPYATRNTSTGDMTVIQIHANATLATRPTKMVPSHTASSATALAILASARTLIIA